tara:strand:+ start:9732 stop:10886 length:1155 start_codon:yes stop_codon:yes gene_type:complete
MNEKSNLLTNSVINIRPVTNRQELKEFIDVPWFVYKDDPMWVPPLRLERRWHFSRSNPFFEHGEWQAWIAYRDNRAVGRISAQIDQLHRQRYGADTGHFGLLESVNDDDVFSELMRTAEKWLAERGTKHISGPYNFSINQECGVLVSGFDTPPMVMMPHTPSWYGQLLDAQGYYPLKDLLAYLLKANMEFPRIMRALLDKFSRRVNIRVLRRNQFKIEMEVLRDIFNDAWSANWGFIPFTEAEFSGLGSTFRFLLRDDYIQIAEVDGIPVAFMVVLPNLNEIFAKLNGNLFPFGWFHLIKQLKFGAVSTARLPLMGVRKKYQNTPLGAALACMMINAPREIGLSMGIKEVEVSWILEDNKSMRGMIEKAGIQEYKRYRIYGKTL